MKKVVIFDTYEYDEIKRAIHVIEYSVKHLDTSYWLGEIMGAVDDIKKVLSENKLNEN